jgi:hypothetical protein
MPSENKLAIKVVICGPHTSLSLSKRPVWSSRAFIKGFSLRREKMIVLLNVVHVFLSNVTYPLPDPSSNPNKRYSTV